MADQHWGDVVLLLRAYYWTHSVIVAFDSSFYTKIPSFPVSGITQATQSPALYGNFFISFDQSAGLSYKFPTYGDTSKWVSGTSDFTLEFRIQTSKKNAVLFDYYDSTNQSGFQVITDPITGVLVIKGNSGGVASNNISVGTVVITDNVRKSVAIVRSGNIITTYVDGVKDTASAGAFTESIIVPPYFSLGSKVSNPDTATNLLGLMDEVRLTKNIARYTDTYTVSPTEFIREDYEDSNYPYTMLSLSMPGSLAGATSTPTSFIDNSYFRATISQQYTVSIGPSWISGVPFFSIGETASNYCETPISAAYGFGTGDFTIDMVFQGNAVTTGRRVSSQNGLFFQCVSASGASLILRSKANTDPGVLECIINGTSTGTITSTDTISNLTWYAISVTRSSGVTRLFIQGVLQGSLTDTNNYNCYSYLLLSNKDGTDAVRGVFKNITVYKGIALYTANYQPYFYTYNPGLSTVPITGAPDNNLNLVFTYIDPIWIACDKMGPESNIDTRDRFIMAPFWKYTASSAITYPDETPYGNITGYTKKDGIAIGNIVVRLYYRPTGTLIRSVRSDASGYFEFSDLALPKSSSDFYVVALIDEAYNAEAADKLTPI